MQRLSEAIRKICKKDLSDVRAWELCQRADPIADTEEEMLGANLGHFPGPGPRV